MWPTLIHIGGFSIATYGALVASAYLLAIYWLNSQRDYMGLSEDRFWLLIYSIFFGAIIGGKLLYVLMDWRRFASGELGVLRDFRYGFVFYGGFLGALLAGFIFTKRTGTNFMKIADYIGVALPLGHWLGRLGCFSAGCCYGRPTSVAWAVRFTNPDSLVPPDLMGVPLHPTQLYEAVGDLAIAGLLYVLLQRVRKGAFREGTVFLSYILAYAGLRFTVEFFRGDDRGGFWLGLSPSQLIALACAAATLPLLWHRGVWKKPSA